MNGTMTIDAVSSGTFPWSDRVDEIANDKETFFGLKWSFSSLCNIAGAILWRETQNISNTLTLGEEEQTNDNVNVKGGWINFAITLFPNSRLLSKEEQRLFEEFKLKKFKKFKLDI